jgi:hypothetical protein
MGVAVKVGGSSANFSQSAADYLADVAASAAGAATGCQL